MERNDRRPFSCSGSLSDTGLLRPATQSTNSSSWVASGSAESDVVGLSSSARDRLRRNNPPSRPRREGCSATFGGVGAADVASVGAKSPASALPLVVALLVVALLVVAPAAVALVAVPEGAPTAPGDSAWPGCSAGAVLALASVGAVRAVELSCDPADLARREVSNAFQVPARLRSGKGARCRGLGIGSLGSSGPLDPSDAVAPVAPGSEVCGGTVHVEVTGQADGAGVQRSACGSLAAVAPNNPAPGTSSAAGRALSVPRAPVIAESLAGEGASAGAALLPGPAFGTRGETVASAPGWPVAVVGTAGAPVVLVAVVGACVASAAVVGSCVALVAVVGDSGSAGT